METKNMYANGKIYKIVNDVNDEIYVGSTVKQLSNRMAQHRSLAKDNTELRELYVVMSIQQLGLLSMFGYLNILNILLLHTGSIVSYSHNFLTISTHIRVKNRFTINIYGLDNCI